MLRVAQCIVRRVRPVAAGGCHRATLATRHTPASRTPLLPSPFNPKPDVRTPWHPAILPIDPYQTVVRRLRAFFEQLGFDEVHTQHNISIMSGCEDPANLSAFQYYGRWFPLKQTNQMDLERYYLLEPHRKGLFTSTASYRVEPNAVYGRHLATFPMFEFEFGGTVDDLHELLRELLCFFGVDDEHMAAMTYEQAAERFDIGEVAVRKEVTHAAEEAMYTDGGLQACLVTDFPERTSPFWNMARDPETGLARKIDVIMAQEVMGSAERSTSAEEMRHAFETIEGGQYARTLRVQCGAQFVDQELEDYLSLPVHHVRSGCGIGLTRFVQSLQRMKLL